jgi:hypothetical protein
MAYTIVKSDGTVLTTIADGTINTTSTSLGLPGRNYAGYGQSLDTNFVHAMENFADSTPPANPLRGQLWYNTNSSTLCVCPADGTVTASSWITLAQSGGSGTTTFGSVTVTGNLQANNIQAVNNSNADTITTRLLTVTANASIATANVTTGNIITLNTANITTGANATPGNIVGTWTLSGGSGGTSNAFIVTGGVINAVNGIKTDNYYYANGANFNPSGSYNNANVFDYLTGSNSVAQFTGNIAPTKITTSNIAGGGTIFGVWTLGTSARLNATYADLAERFESDSPYDAGTVVELGGEAEITAVVHELSEDVFGVVSNTAAYLMNAAAGNDDTHPAVAVGGRIHVKVTGKVCKGDRLVSAGNGIARAATAGEATSFNVIGRALANKTTDNIGTVEAFVSIKG